MLQTSTITNTHVTNVNTMSKEITSCIPHSIDEVIRVVESAIQIGLEAEPLPNILDSLSNYIPPLEKISTQPPAYAPPSPPLITQHSNSASISSVPSENPSSISTGSSLTLSEILNHWWVTERTYIIELSVFQELLLRGALVSQLSVSSLETISRCISIFITASSSIINTFEMYIPQHLLHKTLMNTIPMFTDTVLESFESYISVYTLKLDDQFLSPDNHKWLTIALYNCGIFQSTSTKKCQWLLSSPLHRVKVYTRIFRRFLRVLASADDELSQQFSYAHQCFHLLLSKARGHIKIIREKMGQTPSAPNNINMLHTLTDSVREIEKELDVSRMKDLFTLQPKKYILDLQPPQLPFVRSVVARSNFFFKMIHSVTGEIIEKHIELVLLTDIVLFLDIETPGFKFLMFQPFLTRIFKVIETDNEQTFLLSIYEREQMYLTAMSRRAKKLWISLLSSSRAVQSINYSTFKLSPVGNPVIPKDNNTFPTIFDEMNHRLSSDLTPFKKILLPSRSLKPQDCQDKPYIKHELSTDSKNDLHTIEGTESEYSSSENTGYQSILTNQSDPSTSDTIITHQNKSEPILLRTTEYIQKTMPRPAYNQLGLNMHFFPQPPDRTPNGMFSFPDKSGRLNNYSTSYMFPRASKIRLETLPEENESFTDNPKSPDINDSKTDKQEESSNNTICSTDSKQDSTSEVTSTSYSINEHNPTLQSKPSDLKTDSKENESQKPPSCQDSIAHSTTDSNASIYSKSTSNDSEREKTESDISTEQTLSDISSSVSQTLTPQLPMPDLGRISLTSMIFDDSIIGFSYSNHNIKKEASETSSSEDSSQSHTEILFRNSKLIDQLPLSFSSENSEILFCEKAVTFFWNSTFWKNIFDAKEKVFLIIKYTCKTDMFTLEIYNLSSQEIIVCGELQRYSTIVRQSKQEISIACFIEDRISYILSQFENDSNADLFYIILYRIINRDNPWILQIFQNHTPPNHEYNASNYPLDTTTTSVNSSKASNSKKPNSILNKSKAKVFIQINTDQWEYLGSGILWITTLNSDSKKNILIAKKTRRPNKSSTILNGVISKSDYRRSGRTCIFVKCFDELANKTAFYMIKVKNEKQAKCIIDVLDT